MKVLRIGLIDLLILNRFYNCKLFRQIKIFFESCKKRFYCLQ